MLVWVVSFNMWTSKQKETLRWPLIILNLYTFSYASKNSLELIRISDNIKIPSKRILVSFDINNLVTSIPLTELKLELLKIRRTNNLSFTNPNIGNFDLCLNQNHFTFNNITYIQLEGLPMDSPSCPLMFFHEFFWKFCL